MTAGERSLLRVGQEVVPETRWPPERLLAQPAGVRPTVRVLLQVGLQDEAGFEGFAALLADVRSGIAVLRVPVRAQGVRSVGAVLALVTAILFLPCMLGHVVLQLSRPFAFVAALWTEVLLLFLVNSHVHLQPRWIRAGVAALFTAVRFLPGVNANVPRDLLLVAGCILTVCAFVHALAPV